MAIQHRRGIYTHFDPTRLVAGEWAVVLSGDPNASDGQAAYVCFSPGNVKRVATFEDMVENICNAEQAIIAVLTNDLTENITNLEQSIETAEAARVQAESTRTTYVPTVSTEGVLSWSNDKGLPNPDPVSIKGRDGVVQTLETGFYMMHIVDGHLLLEVADNTTPPPLSIVNKHLVYTIED